MDSATSDGAISPLRATATDGVKVVVVGGFGVGKTTLVGAVSEIRPLHTEETMTRAAEEVDDLAGVEEKSTTTVAFDFGRITINDRVVLYLFGTPGQERFWFLWDRLFSGAIGAVVLVDTRRLDDSFAAVDRLERRGLPFVVAVNLFDDAPVYALEEIRAALDLPDGVPLMACDARDRASSRDVLVTLIEHSLETLAGRPGVLPAAGA